MAAGMSTASQTASVAGLVAGMSTASQTASVAGLAAGMSTASQTASVAGLVHCRTGPTVGTVEPIERGISSSRRFATGKHHETCIKSHEIFIKNDGFCIKNDGSCTKNDGLCSSQELPPRKLAGLASRCGSGDLKWWILYQK